MDLERLQKLRRERSGSTSSGSSLSPTSSSDDGRTHSPLEEEEEAEERYYVSTVTVSFSPNSAPFLFSFTSYPRRTVYRRPPSPAKTAIKFFSPPPKHPSSPVYLLLLLQSPLSRSFQGVFSISKGKRKAKKRGGVYAWEAEVDEGDGNGGPEKATAKKMPSQVQVQVQNLVKRSLRSTSKSNDNDNSVQGRY